MYVSHPPTIVLRFRQVCIGKRFAEEESMLLLASLILHFDISLHSVGSKVEAEAVHPTKLCDIPTVSNVTLTFEEEISLQFLPVTLH